MKRPHQIVLDEARSCPWHSLMLEHYKVLRLLEPVQQYYHVTCNYSMYSHSKNDVVDCSSIMVCHGLSGIFIYTTFLHVAQREQIYIVDHASNTQQSHTVTYSHYSHYSHCDYSHFSVSLQSPQYSNYSRKRRSTPTTTAPSLCRASLTRAPIGSMAG